MNARISKGDLLIINGLKAVAAGDEFTQLHYDEEAREMARYGLDYGVARGAVRAIMVDSGREVVLTTAQVRKVADAPGV